MFIDILRRLKLRYAASGSSSYHILTIMTGTTIAQAIPIAISPILTRLYSPSDFGVFALFSAIVSIAAIMSTGRYELAIVLPEKDKDAINLLALSVFISFGVGLSVWLLVAVFHSELVLLLGNPGISTWLYWVPISVLLTGLYQALNYWSSRKKRFDRLAVSRITQSTSGASANLYFGYCGLGVSGLIVGNLVGQSCATIALIWQVWRDEKSLTQLISKKSMKRNASEYRAFPLVNSFHAFLDAVQSSGIIFIIAAFFGSTILGFYSFTLRVLKTPLGLVGSSVSQVFFQKAAETYNEGGDLHHLLRKTMIRLAIIAFPMFVIIGLFSPDIFEFFFGKPWREAGEFAQILTPWIFLNFIVSPIAGVYLIVGKQKQAIFFALGDVLTKVGSVVLGAYFLNAKLAFYLMSIAGVLTLIIGIIWTFKITSKKRVVCA